MNEANTLFFAIPVLEENLLFVFSKYLKETMNNFKWRKDTERESENNIFVFEILYSKYQLIKSMYKTIASLFLQKSLNAYRNTGRQLNQKS